MAGRAATLWSISSNFSSARLPRGASFSDNKDRQNHPAQLPLRFRLHQVSENFSLPTSGRRSLCRNLPLRDRYSRRVHVARVRRSRVQVGRQKTENSVHLQLGMLLRWAYSAFFPGFAESYFPNTTDVHQGADVIHKGKFISPSNPTW